MNVQNYFVHILMASMMIFPLVGQSEEVSPIVESTLKSIERSSKGLQQSLNPSMDRNSFGCKDCAKTISDIRYMECSEKNSYLEKELQDLGTQSPFLSKLIEKGVSEKSLIKPFCLRLGMDSRFSENSTSFRYCGINDIRAHKAQARPCVSEKYFSLINNSFDLVSRCMKAYLDPQASEDGQNNAVLSIYSLINVESGFHLNAMSSTGSGGIGQFTSSAISEINKNEIKDVQDFLSQSTPECQDLSKEILSGTPPMQQQKSRSCDRIAISKGNPALSMIYTYAYAAHAKKEILKRLNSSRIAQKLNLTDDQKDKLSMNLAVWSHNTGIAGVMKPFFATMNLLYPKGKTISDVNLFMKQMKEQVSDYPHPTNSSVGRRRETSNYFPAIQSTLNSIQNSVEGNTCLNK